MPNTTTSSSHGSPKEPMVTEIQFLDLIRNLVPENLFMSTIAVHKTRVHSDFYNEEVEIPASSVFTKTHKQGSTNILGLVMAAIIVGMVLAKQGKKGKVVKEFVDVSCDVTMDIIQYIMYFVPLGVMSLIARAIVEMEDGIGETLASIGFYMMTVMIGLVIHWFVILPAFYFFIVKKNPYKFMVGLSRALVMAFGTSSSACTTGWK